MRLFRLDQGKDILLLLGQFEMNYEFEMIEDLRKSYSTDNFLREFKNNLSPKVCKKIISLFEKQTDLSQPGSTGSGLNTKIKDSLDLGIGIAISECKSEKRRKKWEKLDSILCSSLDGAVNEYYKEFSVFESKYDVQGTAFHRHLLTDTGYQIQKTTPESGGYIPHNDSSTESIDGHARTRQLTFIWYLNTTDGGPTGFITGEDIQPEEGKLVLFPATWPMIHWGVPPKSGSKYIVTGWLYG